MRTTLEHRTTISRSPPSTPRMHLQPPQPPGGVRTLLNGGWWPRSADPVAESVDGGLFVLGVQWDGQGWLDDQRLALAGLLAVAVIGGSVVVPIIGRLGCVHEVLLASSGWASTITLVAP
jgi:hypothetical protein